MRKISALLLSSASLALLVLAATGTAAKYRAPMSVAKGMAVHTELMALGRRNLVPLPATFTDADADALITILADRPPRGERNIRGVALRGKMFDLASNVWGPAEHCSILPKQRVMLCQTDGPVTAWWPNRQAFGHEMWFQISDHVYARLHRAGQAMYTDELLELCDLEPEQLEQLDLSRRFRLLSSGEGLSF